MCEQLVIAMFQNAFEYLCENPRAWPVIAALAFVVQYVIIAFKVSELKDH